ncbi:hypothetical protein IH779_03700 [Patescibacteria group bacterium]|nr:hypothetical protein [Patescibacteria group bacterium]
MAKILIFGDSIAHGAWDTEKGGWVQRTKSFLDEETLSESENEHTIYNLGVSGNNTEDLLERFEFETKQRLKEDDEELIFIFAIGVNDSQFIHSKNGLKFSPEEYKSNLNQLLNLAKKFSSKIIFVGLTPVDEAKTTPIPWNTDKSYKNEYIKKFNDVLSEFCKEKKIYFIEIFKELIEKDYQSLLEDGLHPNSEGHKKVFEIVRDFIIKNKIL